MITRSYNATKYYWPVIFSSPTSSMRLITHSKMTYLGLIGRKRSATLPFQRCKFSILLQVSY